jgi:hypothetical protein
MDDCSTVSCKTISLSKIKNIDTFCREFWTFSLILMGKLCDFTLTFLFTTQLSHALRSTCNYIKEASPLLAALFIVSKTVKVSELQEFARSLGFFIMLSITFTDSVSSYEQQLVETLSVVTFSMIISIYVNHR